MCPKLSIIIPCYNSEATLEETLKSVLDQEFESWEALIVNDGSPDNVEAIALKWTEKDQRFKYYKKNNGGLGTARNYGIEKASGSFILPLDSDNRIRPNFVKSAIKIFENNAGVDVVYGNAMKFGEVNVVWDVGKFDILRMLHHNYIDACSVIRKEIFDKMGMYDEKIPYQGHEDWEFWLRLIKNDVNFFYLKEITFDYRVTSSSMIRNFNSEMLVENETYIKKKHSDLYQKYYSKLFRRYDALKKEQAKSLVLKLEKKIKQFFS